MVAEMIKALPIVVVYMVTTLFVERYTNKDGQQEMMLWPTVMLVFLRKVALLRYMKKFRGVFMAEVM